ncbi:MAG: hypothetical protein A2252_06215 [Elusimicrobia bacterium RIFOXYA2_FULL_39_19]|nr:MAG: hypothetical protein A2252_06215 [Elusimicrobia bacterium RIFOXYA2_FULL_39_19]
MNDNGKLLTVQQVAEMLGLSPNTVYCWVCQKRIPYLKIGRLTKFSKEDINNWIEKQKVAAIIV